MPDPIPVRVALRIRPLVPRETGDGCKECIKCIPGHPQVVIGEDKAFTYDYVFETYSKQEDLYNKTVIPLVEGFFKGYNATVLAYGQTGSGKTYSMGTAFTMCSETDETKGVIPRLINTIFKWIEERKDKTEFLLKVSFLEIHNEEIHDLLNPCPSDESRIAIRDTHDGGIKIAGLQELTVRCGEDLIRCLEQGSASRATGATAMNSRSSRSHAIFTITMEQKELQGSELRKAKFHLVDLAGSERVKKTHAQGERFKEGVNINKGLLALGNVISALSDELKKSNAHVPYRDSKLTRLLQDSLGGNSNTLMIACVSPADNNFEETLNTLRYADRARQIKNKPIVNIDPAAAELANLRQQVQMLQMQLLQGQTVAGTEQRETGCEATSVNIQEMVERITELEAENEKLGAELHASIDQNTQMYEKVLVTELARDKIIRKFNELKGHFSSKVAGTDAKADLADDVVGEVSLVEELQSKLHELEDSINSPTQLEDVVMKEEEDIAKHNTSDPGQAAEGIDHSSSSPPSDSTIVSQHALRQAELGRQLQELTKALTLKEELANKMVANDSRLTSMRKQYEDTVRELEGEVSRLEREKANLNLELSSTKSELSEGKTREKNRNRIKELEAKISELKKKQVEQQKLLKLKEQSDSTIKKLNTEIQGMKSARVKLMRQMKEESERFRALKAQKEKEINQLKQQGRKRQFEYKKLESIHLKQQAVLKRKTEEVSAVQKRLKMALDRQKEALEKRHAQQQNQQKQADGLVPRMKSWLSHEVEVLVSVGQARQTLESLIDDRKALSRQLAELRNRMQDEDNEPAAKKVTQDERALDEKKCNSLDQQSKITELEKELELRSSQISSLQYKIIDAEQGGKTKHRWSNINTMAECKASLQVLLDMTVAAKLINASAEKSNEKAEQQNQELRSREQSLNQQHNAEILRITRAHDEVVTKLKEQHEETVQCLLHQMPSADDALEPSKEELQELVANLQQENSTLNEKLNKLSDIFACDSPPAPLESMKKAKKAKKSKELIEVIDIDWYGEIGEESEPEDCVDRDPDWVQTPLVPSRRSGRRTHSGESKLLSAVPNFQQIQGCNCTGKCATNNCPCRGTSADCSEDCDCKTAKCVNRNQGAIKKPFLPNVASKAETQGEPDEERKFLNQVENIPTEGFQKPTKVKRRNSSKKGSENKPLPRKRLNIIHKPHSSTSVSSSDEDTAQQIRIRQGSTPSRLGHRHVTGTPGFGFGSGKKVILKKAIPKFNPENKRKKKLLKPSNTASSLGLKV
ncbi:LOW QUALITY PROTEIN: chromosome-associated kinesin KIF4-like [Acropora palmata]|uniref:LOW QUALITY PROTEIN: chromosome-associated kinesin KIF4-like n=1 Tax=Acropora palmata TaxID=6131 RepID=UPI003DA09709